MIRVQFRVHGMGGHLGVDLAPGQAALFGSSPDPARLPPGATDGQPRIVRVPSALVSSNHVLVLAHATGAWVLDLQSRNGTSVRHEPNTVVLEVSPRAGDARTALAFPEGAVWSSDEDFGASVLEHVTRWLRRAQVDADATIVPIVDGASGHAGFKLATGERLLVVPRAGTHDLRLADDLAAVARFVEQQNALHDEERDHEPDFVLRSAATRAAHHAVCEAARRGLSLVLLGPSGTGKERFARRYHQHSLRDGPFVPVNCGAIPEGLVESELFGCVPGAFSGAVDRPGLFEAAHRGTLLLDEIADLPAAVQVKLLRVLEEGTVRRVGDVRERRVDVRVVCATSRDLRTAVDAGRFRLDLWHRIAQQVVVLPPLRERTEDIEALLRAQPCGERRSAWDALGPDARAVVRGHPWPGNARELIYFARRLPVDAHVPLDAATCRRLLDQREPPPLTVREDAYAPAVSTPNDWKAIESRVWAVWLRAHGAPPATFQDLSRFVDDYLKPAFVAWHGNVPTDASALREIAINPIAKRLGVDWNTANKWITRYFETFGEGTEASPRTPRRGA